MGGLFVAGRVGKSPIKHRLNCIAQNVPPVCGGKLPPQTSGTFCATTGKPDDVGYMRRRPAVDGI